MTIEQPKIPDPLNKLYKLHKFNPKKFSLPREPYTPPTRGKDYGMNSGFPCPKCGLPTLIVEKKGELIKCTACHTSWSRVE